MACGETSSANSGSFGASRTLMPVEWDDITSTRISVSTPPSADAISAMVWFDVRFNNTPTSPKRRLQSTRPILALVSAFRAIARLDAIVLRPTPPFALTTAKILPNLLRSTGLLFTGSAGATAW